MINNKIQHRYQVLFLYEQRLITANIAANSLGVTERQFYRVLAHFKELGRDIEGLKYQSHPAWNRTSLEVEKKILELNENYPQALNSHLSWLAWDLHDLEIKSSTVRSILINNNRYIPFKEKK